VSRFKVQVTEMAMFGRFTIERQGGSSALHIEHRIPITKWLIPNPDRSFPGHGEANHVLCQIRQADLGPGSTGVGITPRRAL
jgi:hypothetical protein